MTISYKYLFLNLLLVITTTLFGQTETKRPTSEFILQGRQYVPNSPWLNVGLGYGYCISEKVFEPNFMADFHFRILKKHNLGIGFLTSRNQFLDTQTKAFFLPHRNLKHSVNSVHAMYGWRYDDIFNNFAVHAGPSLNWGFDFAYTDTLGNNYVYRYLEPGLYATVQYSRKVYYDIGIGVSIFASVNKSYQVTGLSLCVYLSSAFKRQL